MAFQYLAFVIHHPPEVVSLTVDLHEDLIQMPPQAAKLQALDPPFPDLDRKYRAEPKPPELNRLVADVGASFM